MPASSISKWFLGLVLLGLVACNDIRDGAALQSFAQSWDRAAILDAAAKLGDRPWVDLNDQGDAIAIWARPDPSGRLDIWVSHYDARVGYWNAPERIDDGIGAPVGFIQ